MKSCIKELTLQLLEERFAQGSIPNLPILDSTRSIFSPAGKLISRQSVLGDWLSESSKEATEINSKNY